jgi:hypothetical protein
MFVKQETASKITYICPLKSRDNGEHLAIKNSDKLLTSFTYWQNPEQDASKHTIFLTALNPLP